LKRQQTPTIIAARTHRASETALFYNHFRYYQPGLGSYSRPDPEKQDIAFSRIPTILTHPLPILSEHNYLYAKDNPLNIYDSNGRLPQWLAGKGAAAAAAAAAGICAAYIWIDSFNHSGKYGDKWRHCYVLCSASRYCGLIVGGAVLQPIGIAREVFYEILDRTGNTNYNAGEWEDIVANAVGGKCSFKFWQPCGSCCDCDYNAFPPKPSFTPHSTSP
jgi:RHS repeat-associated protein